MSLIDRILRRARGATPPPAATPPDAPKPESGLPNPPPPPAPPGTTASAPDPAPFVPANEFERLEAELFELGPEGVEAIEAWLRA